MSRPIYKTNDLFRGGHPWQLNACIGKNGGPYNLNDYCLGYFDAARVLVQATTEGNTSVDLAVYPITYNFRHAIELGLKYLADLLPAIWNETVIYKPTHKLLDVWQLVRPYLLRDPAFNDSSDPILSVDEVLADIIEFDPDAEVFRFPKDRGGRLHLQDVVCINIAVLGEALELTRQIFEKWFITGQTMLDMKHEFEADMI